jgi:asparagine synthase (glutamine-hydrolysing)
MSQVSASPVRTFTIGFADDDGFDEREYARTVSRHCGTDHVELVVDPAAVDLMEQLVWHHDQPFGDSSAVPTFLLSQMTRRDVTVALCGDGGDEVFAGYERFAAALAVARYQRLPQAARRMLRTAADAMPRQALRGRVGSAQRFVASADLPVPHALRSWVAPVPDAWRAALLTDVCDKGLGTFDSTWAQSGGGADLNRLLHLNLRTYLLDDLLPKVDRMSMAHGLEVRSPFLDTELVEFCLRVPPKLHLRGFSRKRVLKAAVRDLLPAEILRRRKRGFGVPLNRWFRTDLSGFVAARLGPADARVKQHLSASAVDAMLGEHASGAADHGHALWTLLTLELFLRREGG